MTLFTILTLRVPHDRRDDVVDYYAAADVLGTSGAVSAKLCVNPDDPGAVVVIASGQTPRRTRHGRLHQSETSSPDESWQSQAAT